MIQKNFFYIKYNNVNKLKEEFNKINLKYDYHSEISGHTLFVMNSEEINKEILNIYIKLINNLN